jgi:TniQ
MSPRPQVPGGSVSPEILGPSRLYRLEPFGLRSAQTEGLDSYFIRLAAAHCVSPRDLLRHELVPIAATLRGTLQSTFPTRFARTINGLGPYATGISGALNRLTGRADLEYLTLRPWRSLFTANGAGLLSTTKRWCSACFSDQRLTDQSPHRLLAWSFDLFTACPTHGLTLSVMCRRCKRPQPFLPKWPVIDMCDHCHAYLGLDVAKSAKAMSVKVAEELSMLLTVVPEAPLLHLRRNLNHFITRETAGNREAFARRFELNPDLIKNWFNKPSLPALPQLMEVAIKLGVVTKDLVTQSQDLVGASPESTSPLKPRKPRVPLLIRQKRLAATLAALVAGPAPPSLADAAKSVGLTPSAHRARCPEECTALIAKRRQVLREQQERARLAIDSAILSAMDSIARSGRQVSRRRVDEQLKQFSLSLRRPNVRARYVLLRESLPSDR